MTVALSGALVASALSYLQVDGFTSSGYANAAQVNADERAAALEARLAAARSERATATRLTTEANAFAAGKRVEALALAEQALLTATTAADGAEPVLGAEGLSALEQAVETLSALVEQAPAPAVTTPVAGVARDEVAPASRSAQPAADTPADTADTTALDTDRADARAADPDEPAPTREAERTPAARVPVEDDVEEPGSSTAAEADAPADADDLAALAGLGPQGLLTLDAQALDLDVTTALVAAAAQVDSLSAEVSQTAQEAVAAQEAARVAAEAAAAERQRKIDVARSSTNGQIPDDVLCDVDFDADVRLRCDAAEALEQLNRAYREAFGHDLRISGTYRSYSAQVSTKAARGYLAASPGTSNHGHAVAVDFADFGGVGQFSGASYRWMKAHADEFGWIHPRIMEPGGGGPQEPWHWEYGTE